MKKSQAADDDDEDLNDTNYDEVTCGAPQPGLRTPTSPLTSVLGEAGASGVSACLQGVFSRVGEGSRESGKEKCMFFLRERCSGPRVLSRRVLDAIPSGVSDDT